MMLPEPGLLGDAAAASTSGAISEQADIHESAQAEILKSVSQETAKLLQEQKK